MPPGACLRSTRSRKRSIARSCAATFVRAGGPPPCASTRRAWRSCRRSYRQIDGVFRALLSEAYLAKGDAVRGYVKDAVAALGGLDVLVNNASAFGNTDDDKGWTSSLAVDMLAIVHATQEALPALQKSKGNVINISSISAHHPAGRQPPYGAIKAAVIHYTTTQAAMYAKNRIRVNCIAPGSIEFPGGTWERAKNNNPNLYAAILRSIPFGRLGQPEEVARVALFLASPLAGWVTGQNIAVDGGQML